MVKAASTYVFVRERLHPGHLDALARAGAEAIELFAALGHFDYHDRNHVKEIAGWFRQSGLALNSLHSPMFTDPAWGPGMCEPINVAEVERKRRIEAMDEIKRALEVAEQLPFRFLVQHLGNSGEEFDPHKQDAAMTSIEHLRAFAKPLGVTVLVENIPNEISTPERLLELVEKAHFHDVGFCFDSGHAHMMTSIPQAFEVMKSNIRSTHLHDNRADRDAHLWPGEGTTEWKQTLELLRTAPHKPVLLLEIEGDLAAGSIPRGIEQAFRKFSSELEGTG